MKITSTKGHYGPLLALLLAPTLEAQTVQYDAQGFESPVFTTGQLAGSTFNNGQNGWLATGDVGGNIDLSLFQVATGTVAGGTQAVEVVADQQPAPYAHLRRNTVFSVEQAEPVVEIQMDMRIESSTTATDAWGLQGQAGPGPGSGIFIWDVFPDDHVHMLENGAFTDTGFVFTRDVWHHVRTAIDYQDQTVTVTIDGQVAGTVPTLSGATSWFFGFASIYLGLPGDDRMQLDNFRILTRAQAGDLGEPYCVSNVNSTGSPAAITASGSASLAANDLILSAGPLPDQPGLFYYGPTQVQLPFGNGFRCVGGTVFRLGVVAGSGGTMTYAVDYGALPGAGQISVGDTWNFQAWFRDPLAGGASFNLSDGLELNFLP